MFVSNPEANKKIACTFRECTAVRLGSENKEKILMVKSSHSNNAGLFGSYHLNQIFKKWDQF